MVSVGGNAHPDEEVSEGLSRSGKSMGRACWAAGAVGTEMRARIRNYQQFPKWRRVTSEEEAETVAACIAQFTLFPEDVKKPLKFEAGE